MILTKTPPIRPIDMAFAVPLRLRSTRETVLRYLRHVHTLRCWALHFRFEAAA